MAKEKETTIVLKAAQQYTDKKIGEVIKHFDRAAGEMNDSVQDLKHHFDEKTKETRLHFSFMVERMEKKLQIVAEQGSANAENIKAIRVEQNAQGKILESHSQMLESHGRMLESHSQMLEKIQFDIQTIKQKMDQTVDRDEFNALEKRLSRLEIKFAKLSS